MGNEKQSIDDHALFDKPKNVKRLLHVLYGSCVLLFILDFVIHRHSTHSWENLWGFYPVYGFIGCVVLVLVARWMRTFLMRPEDYYASEGKGSESMVDVEEPPCVEENSVVDNSVEEKQNIKSGDHDVDA